MPLPDRQQKPVRLTPENAARMSAAAKSAGKYEQRFMEDAIMKAVAEEEARRGAIRAERAARREDRDGRRRFEEPVGLGLRPRTAPETTYAPPEQTQPVVVNVGAAAGGDAVSRLATWIAKGSSWEQRDRMSQALDILEESGGGEQDREALRAQLEAAVAAKQPRKSGLMTLLTGNPVDALRDILK